MSRNLARRLATPALTLAVNRGQAGEWRYSLGIHDMAVPDVDSRAERLLEEVD